MLTLFVELMSAPACNNTPTTSIRPLIAPWCKAVMPSLYVYNNEIMMAIISQSYSQYHLLVLYYYYITNVCINIYIHESPLSLLEK